MVTFIEDASRAQRNANRPEVILAYNADGNGWLIEVQELRLPRKPQPSPELKVGERQMTNEAGGFNSGERGNALQNFTIKSVAPAALLASQRRRRDLRREQVVRPIARIDFQQFHKTPDKQSGPHEQHNGQSHFHDHQEMAQPCSLKTLAASAFFERVV